MKSSHNRINLDSYPVIATAVVAPLPVEMPGGFRLPALVLEMVRGVVVGPHVLWFARADDLQNEGFFQKDRPADH